MQATITETINTFDSAITGRAFVCEQFAKCLLELSKQAPAVQDHLLFEAQKLVSLEKVSNRNWAKFEQKIASGERKPLMTLLEGSKGRRMLETACAAIQGKSIISKKLRHRIRVTIDGVADIQHTRKEITGTSGQSWNKQRMTIAHNSHNGASNKRTTANYRQGSK